MSNRGRGPNFLCVGLQKAGTTWLYHNLREHPDFCMPPVKELHFFDREFPIARIVSKLKNRALASEQDQTFAAHISDLPRHLSPNVDAYASLFDFASESLITGDITPAYGTLPAPQIEQIARRLPHLKVAMMLRNPIKRLWSQANDLANHGIIPATCLSTVEGMRSVIGLPRMASRSYPARIYRKWAASFRSDKIGTFFLEEIAARPDATRARILAFLGGNPEWRSKTPASYNSKAHRKRFPMADEVETFLVAEFEEELRDCARLFGGPAKCWLREYGI